MGLRKWGIASLALVLALATVMAPASAWIGGKGLLILGNIVVADQFLLQKPSVTLFHKQDLATTDTESFALSFPFGAADGALTTTGLPTIAQTADSTIAGTSTGFITANWCYVNLNNPGGYVLTPDVSSWHPMRSASMAGSGLIWPYMTPMTPVSGMAETVSFKPYINDSPGAPDTSAVMLSSNATRALQNGPGVNATQAVQKVAQGSGTNGQKPQKNYKSMTKEQIRNESSLERMYRNANLKNTVPDSYKGSTAYPTWIDPYENVLTPIMPPDKNKVMKEALGMCNPGQKAYTLFWDL